jgi:hypothetical protein
LRHDLTITQSGIVVRSPLIWSIGHMPSVWMRARRHALSSA